ncbi:putative methenyltetrahydrofolate cyclohydrolase, Methylenetetrahydrofolate dehydrogenase (NADP(+)) [Helianthus annuus]|nr:putative methenyltetrahydrofolate cyclohydrolase, Methylenetetrahydrofolate dehydrogenase (NADP(+)) [Helianthus annuus]KAJ0456689.1 putative methenyltetrahydrofolate cyclohydrolase, Methylenetetrahydrofolate dehydrogenase (NADP(+)) [Helianthus annuus]KAJ0473844.1 putative methenyltetrahydrofolate cyclohydrolase, Methylenetetrahydrofolate dehydrogenase (NADP(+)) [Helianthus annuus]KAJ0649420.1 putative methenyltetrahydrofolate cyclohydrolase, Methylenetetrahydrofolate dehydrogenase (NADP(+)) [
MKWTGSGQMQTFCFMYVIALCSDDTQDSKGSHVTGDVCYEEAIVKASLLTPVPGGVGPVTISMLLCNTVEAAKRSYQWTENS